MARRKPNLVLLRSQAISGSRQAQRLLGEWYLNRRGRPRDIREAALWLSRASKSGDPGAKKVLRDRLRIAARHEGTDHLEFIRIAAEEEVGQAQRLLGKKYLYGRCLPRDIQKAATWLDRAALNRDRGAQELRRETFQRAARYGGSSDLEFVRVFAERGEALAQWILGKSYLEGSSAKGNYRLAERWLQRAADQGHADALYRLGMMCLDGLGMRLDRQMAIRRITTAAKQGSSDAQCYIVRMYFVNSDTLCDRTDALEWLERVFQRCAKFHDAKSCRLLEESKMWLLRAANRNDARVKCIVGRMYLLGIGMRRDRAVALKWLREASEQGNAEATRLLALNSIGGPTSSTAPGSTATAHT